MSDCLIHHITDLANTCSCFPADLASPKLLSFAPVTPLLTNATVVHYRLVLSEAVAGGLSATMFTSVSQDPPLCCETLIKPACPLCSQAGLGSAVLGTLTLTQASVSGANWDIAVRVTGSGGVAMRVDDLSTLT